MGSTDPAPPRELTGEEAALYDRQIRLWGLEAQRKLAASHVFVTGAPCSPVGQELCKNITLSGVARLALCQSRPASPGFLGSDVAALAATLTEMNPLVDVAVVEETEGVGKYNVVCAVGMEREGEADVAKVCREAGVMFMGGRVAGQVAWLFLDLGQEYQCQVKIPAAPGKESSPDAPATRTETLQFCSYEEAVASPWGNEVQRGEFGWHVASVLMEFEAAYGRLPNGSAADDSALKELYSRLCTAKMASCTKEEVVEQAGSVAWVVLPPVAAILGGMWGREVVKVVSGNDEPLNNFFFFNAASSVGSVEKVGPTV